MAAKSAPKSRVTKPLHSQVGFAHLLNPLMRGATATGNIATGVDIRTLIQSARSETEVIRILNNHTSVLSSSVFHMVEMANTDLKVKATNRVTGQPDKIATDYLKSFVTSLDDPADTLKGFNHKAGLASLNATLLQEAILTGAVATELVLNGRDRSPSYIVPLPVEYIRWEERKANNKTKKNKLAGQMVPNFNGDTLDYPNIFYSALHQQANSILPVSMLNPAVGVVSNFARFMEDLHEVIDISGHSRLTVTIDREAILKYVPEDCMDDQAKRDAWLEQQRSAVGAALESLSPEQALVLFSDQEAQILQGNNTKSDYSALLGTLLGILALSLKSHPSVLGLRIQGGSQNLSSTESLLAIKAASSLHRPVQEVWSRMGNLALRLAGFENLVCEAKFKEIELRPSLELESHKLIRQKRILEQLSLGLITDEAAVDALELPGLPEDYEPLSGTKFYEGTQDINAAQAVSDSQDAAGRTLTPDSAKGTE